MATPKKAPTATKPATTVDPNPENRTAGGRRRVPLGIREGGAEWERLHTELAVTALQVLAERGYADMVMDEVAERAGASKRTVYRHYPTKVDLAVAAIRQVPTYAGWAEGSGTFADRLARAIGIGADRAPMFVPVLATALVHRDTVPELLDAVRNHVVVPRQAIIAGFIAEGIAAGEIRPGVDPLAVSALLTGIHVQHLDGTRPLGGKAGARVDFDHVWPLLRA
ncbi:MAG: TetR/AcrR family transcriptional regulator [Candidatus Nanopelagicales bacterium]